MDKIEQVARAMCADDSPHNDWDSRDMSDFTRDAWRKMAKAAIGAIREPTEDMLRGPDRSGHECYNMDDEVLKELYQGMIDVALKAEDKQK